MRKAIAVDAAAHERAGTGEAVSGTAARLSLGAAVASLVLVAALHFLKPELDPSWRFLSEYAIGPFGWMMQLAFLALAVGFVALSVAIRSQVRTLAGKIGLGLGLVAAAAMVGAAFFTIDPITASPDELTAHGSVHGLTAMVGNPAAVLSALLVSISLARHPAWAAVRGWVLTAGSLPLLSLVLMFAVLGITLSQAGAFGPAVPVGWPNRLLVLTYCAWLIVPGWHALRLSRQQN